MKLMHSANLLLVLTIAFIWFCQAVSSEKSAPSKELVHGTERGTKTSELFPRGLFSIGGFRPMMRFIGMMGLPLIPLMLIRQLVAGGAGGAAAAASGQGGLGGASGAGLGGLGGLLGGGLAPLAMGGGLRPLGGGGLRPLGGGLRPGGLRPFSGLLGNVAGAGGAGAASGASGATALFLQKRSVEEPKTSPFTNFLKALVKLEKVFDMYDLSVPDCQRLIVCEVHRRGMSPNVGSFAEKMLQAFGVEARLERSRFRSNTKSVLKDFLKAARLGLQQKTCETIYQKCPAAVARAKKE